jgi:hypothetical protein
LLEVEQEFGEALQENDILYETIIAGNNANWI